MLKPQKKTSPHKIKEDKFVETMLEAKVYLEENYKHVFTIVTVVFVVILAIMGYVYIQEQETTEAQTLFGKAQMEYQNFDYTKAKRLLIELADNYSGTEPGKQGILFLANIYYQEKNIEQAKQYYDTFLDEYSGSGILLSSGYAGYAACLETESQYMEAAQYYEKANKAAPQFVEASNYLYLAGKNYLTAEENEKARKIFNRIQEDYPDSKRNFDTQAQLILLDQK